MTTKRQNLSNSDVASMRLAADWWDSNEAAEEYPDDDDLAALAADCRTVADDVEAAIARGDDSAARHAAAQWPSEAGPWRGA